MAHILGIPNITLADHEQYNNMKDWAEAQDFKTAEQVKHEIMFEILTRKPFNNGLYGKDYNHRDSK